MEILIKSLKDCWDIVLMIVGMSVITSCMILFGMYVYEGLEYLEINEEISVIISFIISVFVLCVLDNLKVKYLDNK